MKSRSLQRRLSLVLGSAILLAGMLAAIASFILAYLETKELQDDMLRQFATISAGIATHPSASALQDQHMADGAINDPESRVTIFHLQSGNAPDWLKGNLSPGFHTVDIGTERHRIFVRDDRSGSLTVVSQPTEARDEITVDSALRTLIPLLLLLPVMAWLIVHIVRSELAQITQLSRSLDDQSADRPQPLASDNIPEEIMPFVQAINRLLERVNRLIGQQRRFIADAAHELRSPLTALSLQAQNLRQAGSLQAAHERVIPLQAGIERARQLTEQLLNLARTQAGTSDETEVNVSAMARELIAEYLPLAESRDIDLGLEEIAPLTLHVSPAALRLIFKNALENALKYTPHGGEVTLRLQSDNGNAVIEIIDNGPGIPAPEREHVFDAFYRAPNSVGEGSGLGLAIAREAALRTGGIVSLHDPHDGSGLVFRYRQARNGTSGWSAASE